MEQNHRKIFVIVKEPAFSAGCVEMSLKSSRGVEPLGWTRGLFGNNIAILPHTPTGTAQPNKKRDYT